MKYFFVYKLIELFITSEKKSFFLIKIEIIIEKVK